MKPRTSAIITSNNINISRNIISQVTHSEVDNVVPGLAARYSSLTLSSQSALLKLLGDEALIILSCLSSSYLGIASVFIKACLTDKTIEQVAQMYCSEEPESSYVARHIRWLKKQHFYTETARRIAGQRNKIVQSFFKALKDELNYKTK